MRECGEYILPARFDDTELPGILATTGYMDLTDLEPEALASLILQKLGRESPPTSRRMSNNHQAGILRLITKLQNPESSVAECVAEGLMLARECGGADLAAFCTNELVGYAEPSDETARARRTHRHMPMRCAIGRVDLTAVAFRGITVMQAIDENAESFVSKYCVLSEPIASIESKRLPENPKGSWHTVLKVSDFNPDADKGELPVHCYSPPDAYMTIVNNVRMELTQRLAALLDSSPQA